MKRPSFQFYPADWRNNAKLRRCSEAARGAWMDVLCVLHDSDEYGVCRWPLGDLARSAGVPLKLIKELADKDVLKGADKSPSDYVFTPRHAGKDGEPVTLVAAGDGPCWYCTRFVRDEYIRIRRGAGSRFDSDNQPPKAQPNNSPKTAPKVGFGERQGDGSTSSSSSSSSTTPSGCTSKTLSAVAGSKPEYPDEFLKAWDAYPKRPGANKKSSHKAWAARIKAGVDPLVIAAGCVAYRQYCEATGTAPNFIKQPETFFGPDEHYLTDWLVAAAQASQPRGSTASGMRAIAKASDFDNKPVATDGAGREITVDHNVNWEGIQ